VNVKVVDRIGTRLLGKVKDEDDYTNRKYFIHALYNVISSAKYLLVSKLIGAIRQSPGITFNDICDVYLIEIKALEEEGGFERNIMGYTRGQNHLN
jgi:hypothetical protein